MAGRDLSIAMGLAAVLASAGCAIRGGDTPTVPPGTFAGEKYLTQQLPATQIVRRSYRLRRGDQLEIMHHVRHTQGKFTNFSIEDVATIRFPFNPSLNQTEKVRPDGALHLALVGAVPVLGKTINEVRDDLTRRYSQHTDNPTLTVSCNPSKKNIAEVTETIKTVSRGQSRPVTITPDGTISLPFIADIQAADKTLTELRKDLNDAYRKVGLEEFEVTVNVQTISPIRIYVLGEVRTAGTLVNQSDAVDMSAEITLLQAIAQAGGYIPGRADLSKVMLIRRHNLPHPQAAIIDLHKMLANRKRRGLLGATMPADSSRDRYDVWLADGDIIYVPTTRTAKRADYLDYVWANSIRAVGGFASNNGTGAK